MPTAKCRGGHIWCRHSSDWLRNISHLTVGLLPVRVWDKRCATLEGSGVQLCSESIRIRPDTPGAQDTLKIPVTNDCHCARIKHSLDNEQGGFYVLWTDKDAWWVSQLGGQFGSPEEHSTPGWKKRLCSGGPSWTWAAMAPISGSDCGSLRARTSVLRILTSASRLESPYENWVEQRKNKEDRSLAERLFLVHAILICVRAKKSRVVDTALIT